MTTKCSIIEGERKRVNKTYTPTLEGIKSEANYQSKPTNQDPKVV